MTAIRTKPRAPEKVKMFIEIAKFRVKDGVIFEGTKIVEILPWENEIIETPITHKTTDLFHLKPMWL